MRKGDCFGNVCNDPNSYCHQEYQQCFCNAGYSVREGICHLEGKNVYFWILNVKPNYPQIQTQFIIGYLQIYLL